MAGRRRPTGRAASAAESRPPLPQRRRHSRAPLRTIESARLSKTPFDNPVGGAAKSAPKHLIPVWLGYTTGAATYALGRASTSGAATTAALVRHRLRQRRRS